MRDLRPLTWPLATAVAGHLLAVVLSQVQLIRPAQGVPSGTVRPWQTRLVPATPNAPAPAEAFSAVGVAGTEVSTQPAPVPATAAAAPTKMEAQTEPVATAAPAAGPPKVGMTPDGAPDGYLPRSALTQAPVPLHSLDVPFPPGVVGTGRLAVPITVFIDEQGRVRHVRMDDSDTPQAFADAIRQTFASASFHPGEVAGVPVRCMVRMEIAFESDAPGQAPPIPFSVVPHRPRF